MRHPPIAASVEDSSEIPSEDVVGVLEILFGVGFGGGYALKRFVEDADDPLLFGERGDGNWVAFNELLRVLFRRSSSNTGWIAQTSKTT